MIDHLAVDLCETWRKLIFVEHFLVDDGRIQAGNRSTVQACLRDCFVIITFVPDGAIV